MIRANTGKELQWIQIFGLVISFKLAHKIGPQNYLFNVKYIEPSDMKHIY